MSLCVLVSALSGDSADYSIQETRDANTKYLLRRFDEADILRYYAQWRIAKQEDNDSEEKEQELDDHDAMVVFLSSHGAIELLRNCSGVYTTENGFLAFCASTEQSQQKFNSNWDKFMDNMRKQSRWKQQQVEKMRRFSRNERLPQNVDDSKEAKESREAKETKEAKEAKEE